MDSKSLTTAFFPLPFYPPPTIHFLATMPSIVLATLNAKYPHCAFGLRYLLANMGELRDETALLEFTINQQTLEILDAILVQRPRIVGLGVYIWNVTETTRLVADLKRVAPDVIVVLGGPEVSYETDRQEIARLADHVISGEADLAFAALCRELLVPSPPSAGERVRVRGPNGDEAQPFTSDSTLPPSPRRGGPGRGEERRAISDVEDSPLLVASSLVSRTTHEAPLPNPPRRGEGVREEKAPLTLSLDLRSGGARRGEGTKPRIIHAPVPTLTSLALPYGLYSDEDLAHRVIYVEASRGCPFTCEFCLSALDIPVRQFPLDEFLAAMNALLQRGTKCFKFVDRTFNLNLRVSRAILDFFLQRYQPGMFLHFELIPDRLPDSLKELIVPFPPGALQFEVGIQTFNDDVSHLISRHQDNALVEQNLSWLRDHTSVHVHADLIVGLPGESLDSFAAGFDRLVKLRPHEIQVGILKRLRGTPIVRHDAEWQMVYSPHPPYEVLQTKLLDFATIQELRRFAKLWDTIANSGNFVETLPLVWAGVRSQGAGDRDQETGDSQEVVLGVSPSAALLSGGRESPGSSSDDEPSPFTAFRHLATWLFARAGQAHGIALSRLVELLFEYLTTERGFTQEHVAAALWRDYQRGGRNDKPHCLRPFITEPPPATSASKDRTATGPKRQGRHHSEVGVPHQPEA